MTSNCLGYDQVLIFCDEFWVFFNLTLDLSKARFAQVGIFFTLRLFAWESFINKKVGIRINYAPPVDNFKSFYNKSGLSFFDFQLFY